MNVNQYRRISTKQVIDTFYNDMNLQLEVRHLTLIDWIGRALELMCTNAQLDYKRAVITIVNHRGILPCDFYEAESVWRDNKTLKIGFQDVYPTLPKLSPDNTKTAREYRLKGKDVYVIGYPYIYTDIAKKDLVLRYTAFATDEDGYPMIPDLEEYKEALTAFIMYKVKHAELFANKISPNEYQFFELDWKRKKSKAEARVLLPTPDYVQSLGNLWQRLVHNTKEHDTLFSTASDQQNAR
jgi:hypothetical protein